jgi:Rieske 2Fe-2S family protein
MYDNVNQRPVGAYSGGWVPLKPGMKTQSLDGKLRSMPLGEFKESGEVPTCWGAGFQIAPLLTRIIAHVDHAMIFSIRPIDTAHVEWVSRWFVHAEAQEARDYDLDELTKVWKATNDQDISLCVGAFRGINSGRYVPGPLSVAKEPAIHTAVLTYLDLMGQPRTLA